MYRDLNQKLASDLSNLLSAKAFWYIVSMATAATLQIAPIAFPEAWKGDAKQAINFSATAACLAIGAATSGRVQRQVTETRINNFVGHQLEIDESVAVINLERAKVMNAIRLLNGVRTQGELQEMMNQGIAMMQMGAVAAGAIEGSQTAGALTGAIIPQEDLAQSIADAHSDEQNFLFVGKSRSGKTTMIINAMDRKNRKYSGNVDWFIFNGKPEQDNNWGGLVESPNDYWAVNSSDKAIEMMRQFKACVQTVQRWQDTKEDHYPMFIVADEVNNQRLLLDDDSCKALDKFIPLYATQAMSEGSGIWLSTHSHNVEDIGLNRKLQQSFQMIAVGRNGKYESIAAVLNDQIAIRDKETRDRLKAQLRAYIEAGGKGSIAFTNLGGDYRLVELPHYSKNIKLELGVLNQSTSEIADEEFVRSGDDDPARSTLAAPNLSLANDCANYISGAIPKYAVNGEWLELRILQQNWAKNRGLNSKDLGVLLRKMYEMGWIKVNPQNSKQIALTDAD